MDMLEVKVHPIERIEFARRHGGRRSNVIEPVGKVKQKNHGI